MAPGFATVNGAPDPSQMTSRIMAPGYMVVALGLDMKPTPTTTVFLAPFTSKSTYVLDDIVCGGDVWGGARERGTTRGGWIHPPRFERKGDRERHVCRELDLFSNYLEEPEAVDIFSDHVLTLKVNDWLSTTLGLTLIYDKDVQLLLREPDPDIPGDEGEMGPGVQLKQILAVGLSLKFS